jgi:hypothetical protein
VVVLSVMAKAYHETGLSYQIITEQSCTKAAGAPTRSRCRAAEGVSAPGRFPWLPHRPGAPGLKFWISTSEIPGSAVSASTLRNSLIQRPRLVSVTPYCWQNYHADRPLFWYCMTISSRAARRYLFMHSSCNDDRHSRG